MATSAPGRTFSRGYFGTARIASPTASRASSPSASTSTGAALLHVGRAALRRPSAPRAGALGERASGHRSMHRPDGGALLAGCGAAVWVTLQIAQRAGERPAARGDAGDRRRTAGGGGALAVRLPLPPVRPRSAFASGGAERRPAPRCRPRRGELLRPRQRSAGAAREALARTVGASSRGASPRRSARAKLSATRAGRARQEVDAEQPPPPLRLHVKEREMTAEELAYDGGKALGRASSPVQTRRPG